MRMWSAPGPTPLIVEPDRMAAAGRSAIGWAIESLGAWFPDFKEGSVQNVGLLMFYFSERLRRFFT